MSENEMIKFIDLVLCELETTRAEVERIRTILRDKRWEIVNKQEEELEMQSKNVA